MENKELLTNREWTIDGNWFAPRNFLRDNFESVVHCNHFDTTSSAGNWIGLVLQRFGSKLYAVLFSQENCFPSDRFTLTTAENPFMEMELSDENPDYKQIFDEAAQAAFEMYYQR